VGSDAQSVEVRGLIQHDGRLPLRNPRWLLRKKL
jgi:hypothetical protein